MIIFVGFSVKNAFIGSSQTSRDGYRDAGLGDLAWVIDERLEHTAMGVA